MEVDHLEGVMERRLGPPYHFSVGVACGLGVDVCNEHEVVWIDQQISGG